MPSYSWKLAALEQHGFPGTAATFPLRLGALPEEALRYAAFAAEEVGSAEQAEALARELFAQGRLPPGSAARRAAMEGVVRRCQAALGGYAGSLECDARELEQLQRGEAEQAVSSGNAGGGGRSSSNPGGGEEVAAALRRRRDVLQVLVAERRILHRAVFLLSQELREEARRGR